MNPSHVNNNRLGVSKGGVAQSRQYKKSFNSKNSSGIVHISSQNGKNNTQMLGTTATTMKRRNQDGKFNGIYGKGQNVTEPSSGLNMFASKVSTESIHGLSNHSG